jgi:hypothetical protein
MIVQWFNSCTLLIGLEHGCITAPSVLIIHDFEPSDTILLKTFLKKT